MGEPRRPGLYCMEVVSVHKDVVSTSPKESRANLFSSYIVYIATISFYLVLVILFFPETRHLTVEEVSVIFDKGRLASAADATAEFQASHVTKAANLERTITEDGKPASSHRENITTVV